MEDYRAITGDFATFGKPIQGRKVIQLMIEIPTEDLHKALAVLGTPVGQPIPVVVARLNPEPSSTEAPWHTPEKVE